MIDGSSNPYKINIYTKTSKRGVSQINSRRIKTYRKEQLRLLYNCIIKIC